MKQIRKAIVALVGAVIGWAVLALSVAPGPGEADVTRAEWIALLIAVGTALGVYRVPNEPPA